MTTKTLIEVALALEQSDCGNFDALVSAFEKCHRADPSNEKMKEKYFSYFKKIFDRQHSKNENADELKQLGNQHLLKQKYEESILFYDAAISVDPMAKEAAPIYSNRSLAFLKLNKFKDAYDDAQMAISVNP
jgi:tetratricopeptide (TPR) repeat protein